ncbi:MAG: hypothetical protein N3C12_08965 [Candidatus Binatia bacterium]|nr:hypothetical protein [Candidatus Binatia bacterium]
MLFAPAAAVAGVRFYFSEKFWPPQSRWVSGEGITQLVESIPYSVRGKLIVAPGAGYFFAVRERTDKGRMEASDTENWWPSANTEVTYAFSGHWELLEPFYRGMVGSERVRAFGKPFSVTFEPRTWDWLREYGWSYEVECSSPRFHEDAQVPARFHLSQTVPGFFCDGPSIDRWTGRWLGDVSNLQFRFEHGEAAVVVGSGPVMGAGKRSVDFRVAHNDMISIALTVPRGTAVVAFLVWRSPAGESVPPWFSVRPELTCSSGGFATEGVACMATTGTLHH